MPIVAGVAERSAAAQGGLRVGDRILAVNGTDVETLDAFRRPTSGHIPAQPAASSGSTGKASRVAADPACRADAELLMKGLHVLPRPRWISTRAGVLQ